MKKTLLLLLFIVVTSCYQETSILIEGDFTISYVKEEESVRSADTLDYWLLSQNYIRSDFYVWELNSPTYS